VLRPGEGQEDKKPEECEQDERRDNMMGHYGIGPLQQVLRWGIVPGLGGNGIIRRVEGVQLNAWCELTHDSYPEGAPSR